MTTAGVWMPGTVLETGLSDHLGREARIAALESEPLSGRSTHPIDRLRVTLTSGQELPVIFKRLQAPPVGRAMLELPKGYRREVLIYRTLLRGRRFGAPALYASVYDEVQDCCWLFLEDVGDRTLDEGDTADWMEAVRWLASMHASYHDKEEHLAALGCLDEHGPEYYRRIADTARQNLCLGESRRALARFDALMARYDSVIARLVGHPRTLVHGDIFTENIMLQADGGIRPVDWESAAIGLAAWDLTLLLDGWGTDRERLLAAYLSEFAVCTHGLSDERIITDVLGDCEVVKALWRLGWSVDDCRIESFVEHQLDTLAATIGIPSHEGRDGG